MQDTLTDYPCPQCGRPLWLDHGERESFGGPGYPPTLLCQGSDCTWSGPGRSFERQPTPAEIRGYNLACKYGVD